MFQLNTFHFGLFSKEKILLFTKHLRIQSQSYNKNKRSFSINPFALILRESERSFLSLNLFIWNLYLFIFFDSLFRFSFPLFSFYSLPSFLKSHRFDPIESDPFSHWARGTKEIRLIFRSKALCEIFGFFLFLYPYPLGTAFESIENLFFCICMNRYYSIPIPSRYLPRKIPNWIPNWRVSVSLSMRLCTLRIGIHFLKDPGFRALAGRPRSSRWPMLCWRDIYMIRSIA